MKLIFVCLEHEDQPRKVVDMDENEIRELCLQSGEIFLSQPVLLELKSPIKVCGKETSVIFSVISMLIR